jgi:3-methyladenine DNA glycosylase AlkD
MLPPNEYYLHVHNIFRSHGKPEVAQGQMWYLRPQFEFFGLKAPEWMVLAKSIHREHGVFTGPELVEFTRICFADDHREMHYFALETVQKAMKKQPEDFINLLETLICTKSWWDSVDWLAKLVGMHFKLYPHLIKPVTGRWMDSGHMWLQRVSMIFQLTYKDKTDPDLMFEYIRRLAGSKEFFIQKGAGWALRQYSKTNPEAVQAFIESTVLAPLTKREGMKTINVGRRTPDV